MKTPPITQEMINLFDDYTHLCLDRRKFMDNLAKLAGSMTRGDRAAALMASNAKAQGLVAGGRSEPRSSQTSPIPVPRAR